jgi:hypothetical protein
MTNRFMISVAAAALIASSGLAYSQGAGNAGSAGSTAQQSAPSGGAASPSAAPMNRDSGGSSGMKGAESREGAKEGAKGGTNNAESREGMSKDSPKNAQSTDSMSKDSSKNAQSREGASKDSTAAKDSKSSTTTGNAATSATVAPPAEKRSQIVSAIKSEKIQETTNVNFNISVGTRVPSSVHFVPLPQRIVEIYPEWRGYNVILVHGRYVIVRPETHEIVYIIEG